jgi:RimJ/RimL family protein N-acetyltransferase
MRLDPIDSSDAFRLVAEWLSQKENYQWLDFGDGRQQASAEWLKMAIQRRTQVARLFTADFEDKPIGVVALGNVNPHFKTATLWVVLGDKMYAGRGYASRAVVKMLTLGFSELGLGSINTWVVEHNPSIRVVERVRFRPIGRQRRCHYIDGRLYDRLWFDLLPTEHQETS